MPELPEVHTTVEGLKKTILKKKITGVWSDFHVATAHGHRQNLKNKKYFEDFKKKVIGTTIQAVERLGKHIVIHLSGGFSIIIHMKMTGHLMVSGYDTSDPYNGHVHFRLIFSDGTEMVLSDLRKFASICIVETKDIQNHPGMFKLGPNPLTISTKEFIERIKTKKHWPIKSVLMDQEVLAGIGNIYSDETLFACSVHPLSKAGAIPDRVLEKMHAEAKRILTTSIETGGDSDSDYRNVSGKKGGFQNFHKVYRKTGKKCVKKNCRGIIERIVVKGRSAHFCPVHQTMY